MVTEDSACRIGFEDNTHDKLPLWADHSGLVKFPNDTDDSYNRVRNTLRELVEAAPRTIKGRFSSYTGAYP